MENANPNAAAAPRRMNPFKAEDRIAFPPVVRGPPPLAASRRPPAAHLPPTRRPAHAVRAGARARVAGQPPAAHAC